MTASFGSNIRILEREADVPEDAPAIERPPSLNSAAPGAIMAEFPHWRYLFTPGVPPRPATEAEAEAYAARKSDPAWADLFRLLLDAELVRARKLGALRYSMPLIPIPAGSRPVVPEPESSGTARPYITVATVPAPEQTLAAAATVSAAASPQEAADPGAEDVPGECDGADHPATAPDETSVMEPVTQLVPVQRDEDGGTE